MVESLAKRSKPPCHVTRSRFVQLRSIPEPKGLPAPSKKAVAEPADELGVGGIMDFIQNINSIPASPDSSIGQEWTEYTSNITISFDFDAFQAHLANLEPDEANKIARSCNLISGRYHGLWIQPGQTVISAYRQVPLSDDAGDVLLVHFSGKDRWVSYSLALSA
jgi:hypothetical protein